MPAEPMIGLWDTLASASIRRESDALQRTHMPLSG